MAEVINPGPHLTLEYTPQYPLRPSGGQKDPCATSKDDEGPKWSVKIPDAARTVTTDHCAQGNNSGRLTSEKLVDMTEIKPLKSTEDEPWGTQEARDNAGELIPGFMFQVYSTAMAAFKRNPKWMHVYTMLVVGIYYTQFHWKRPSKKVLNRVPIAFGYFSSIPNTRTGLDRHQKLIWDVEAAMEECKNRPMPEILCWNEPIVTFGPGCDITSRNAKAQLTPQFIWSMRQPFRHHYKTRFDRSWMSPPRERPQEVDLCDLVCLSPFLVYVCCYLNSPTREHCV